MQNEAGTAAAPRINSTTQRGPHQPKRSSDFASPTNVEEALWDEFERQPSIQLLHSIRTDLHSQLSNIISKLEQSLANSCAERSTRTEEQGESDLQGGPKRNGPTCYDDFHLRRMGRPDGLTETLDQTSVPSVTRCSVDAAMSEPQHTPVLFEQDGIQPALLSRNLNRLLSPGRLQGRLEFTGPSIRAAGTCEPLKQSACVPNIHEDKENVVNASAGMAGAKSAKNRGRGPVAFRLAVRENDLWC